MDSEQMVEAGGALAVGNSMESLRRIRLGLFLTKGGSLRLWNELGLLDREARLYAALAEHGVDLTTIFSYGDERDVRLGMHFGAVEVVPKKVPRLRDGIYSLVMPVVLDDRLSSIDVLKTNQLSGSWPAVVAKYLYGCRLVVRCGYQWSLFARKSGQPRWRILLIDFLELLAYKSSDLIFVTTSLARDYVVRRYRIPRQKIYVIPNGIDTALFRPSPKTPRAKGEICFVGRLSAQKNLGALIQAVKGIEDAKIKIIGTGELAEFLACEARVHDVKLELKGRVPNDRLPGELNSAQIFVMPSQYEGHPKAVLEAMACGLPVVASDTPEMRCIITHGENGFLCKPEPDSLRSQLLYLLNNPDVCCEVGERARAYVEAHYQLRQVALAEAQAIRGLLFARQE